MGISSHQVRLLQLTDRNHTIGRELTRLANDKVDLTRDMSKATTAYQQALNAKTLKWSANSGVSYVDLTYKNLMRPSQMNANTAYLLTDSSDRVLIDYNYKKYAEMISAKGAPGGDWEGNRAKILAELVGVSESTINGLDGSSAKVQAAKANLDAVKAKEPSSREAMETDSLCCLLENVGSLKSTKAKFVDADDWADAYQHGKSINLGSDNVAEVLKSVAQILKDDLSKYFVTESSDFDPEKSPILGHIDQVVSMIDPEASEEGANNNFISKDKKGNSLLNVQNFIDTIMLEMSQFINCEDSSQVNYYDTTSKSFQTYLNRRADWENELKAAQNEYNSAVDADNTLLTADQERQINFYDDLFSTIADKGWTYNENVNDEDYLNQMLQNNIFTITTVDRNRVEDETTITEDYYWENTYNTDIATNYTNIFAVNDTDARNDAQVEYEKTKAIINTKETQIDTRMQNLKTEQQAINTMIQSIQSILDENVEDSFSIYT